MKIDKNSSAKNIDSSIEDRFNVLKEKIESGFRPDIQNTLKEIKTMLNIALEKNRIERTKEKGNQDLCKTGADYNSKIFGELTLKLGKQKAIDLCNETNS